jgi:hypothetical protein
MGCPQYSQDVETYFWRNGLTASHQRYMMNRDDMTAVLAIHFETHQALAPQDVYKLLYQGVMGPEHLIADPRAARERLYLEVLHLPAEHGVQSILEPVSPVLCRINLQPYVQGGGSVAILWRLFRQTARDYKPGTLVDLDRAWRCFRSTSWAARYTPEKLEQFWQCMATAGFPSVHHSRGYAEANKPHYRVVLRELMADKLGF